MISNESINPPSGGDNGQALAAENARKHQQLVNTYHRVFSNPDGIMVIADLVAYFKTNVPAFAQIPAPHPVDPFRAGALEGQRSVLLRIQNMLLYQPKGDANAAESARPPVRR